jgi:hypothetical protein
VLLCPEEREDVRSFACSFVNDIYCSSPDVDQFYEMRCTVPWSVLALQLLSLVITWDTRGRMLSWLKHGLVNMNIA